MEKISKDKYYDKMSKIDYHDGIITKYERNNNDIIIEFEDGYHRNFTTRLIFINATIDSLEDILGADIFYCTYKSKDSRYYTTFDIHDKKFTIIAEEVKVLEFITNELYENYITSKEPYINNLKKISIKLDKEVLEKINMINDLFVVKEYYKDNHDLSIEFKHISHDKTFILKFIDCSIKILKNGEILDNIAKDNLLKQILFQDDYNDNNIGLNFEKGFWKFRFCESSKSNFEIGIYLSNDIEAVITCKDIK